MRRTGRAFKEISYWQPKFRLLKDWVIDFDTESEYKDQCSYGVKEKEAVIYDWSAGRMPKDYIFHEMVHIAMAVVRETKHYSRNREAEEILVQDLSKIMILTKPCGP